MKVRWERHNPYHAHAPTESMESWIKVTFDQLIHIMHMHQRPWYLVPAKVENSELLPGKTIKFLYFSCDFNLDGRLIQIGNALIPPLCRTIACSLV